MIIAKQTTMMTTLGMNAYHHHFGVLPSATPEIWSDSHPSDRLFNTNGSRSSSFGVEGITGRSLAKVSEAISALLSSHPAPRHDRPRPRACAVHTDDRAVSLRIPSSPTALPDSPASSDSDCGCAPCR